MQPGDAPVALTHGLIRRVLHLTHSLIAEARASVVLREGDELTTTVASDDEVSMLDRVQCTKGHGPATRSLDTGEPTVVDDVDAHVDEWPEFTSAARRIGVTSVLAVPIGGRADVGILSVYAAGARSWRPSELERATDLAAVLDGCISRNREIEDLRRASHLRAVLSHETRNRANVLRGFTDLLALPTLEESVRREATLAVAENIDALIDITDDFLELARSDATLAADRLQTLDLGATVDRSVRRLQAIVGNHQLATNLEPGVRARLDPNALERVLANLLSNAAKYAPEGTTVTVTVEGDDHGATLVVDDQGPGVPPAERTQIFERFWRSRRVTDEARGVGLGLAIVTELLDNVHASIHVSNSPSGGARFVIRFPPVRDDHDEENQHARHDRRSPPQG